MDLSQDWRLPLPPATPHCLDQMMLCKSVLLLSLALLICPITLSVSLQTASVSPALEAFHNHKQKLLENTSLRPSRESSSGRWSWCPGGWEQKASVS